MFRRSSSQIGFFLLILFTLIVSFTNTWKFVVEFLPDDPPWLRYGAFVFFEGGLILWAQYFKHDSDNVYRTWIAGLMTFISLIAVLTATGYEIARDVHKLGFVLSPTIAAWIPVSILLVMLGQTIALVLHHFADERFFARMRHMNATGQTPYTPRQEVTGHLVQLPQNASTRQPKTIVEPVAPPAPQQLPAPQTTQKPGLRQRIGNWLAGPQAQTDTLWEAYERAAETDRIAREHAPQQQNVQPDVKAIVAAQKEYDKQHPTPHNTPQQDYMADLVDSVGGDTGPFTSAPSPNGAKLNGQK